MKVSYRIDKEFEKHILPNFDKMFAGVMFELPKIEKANLNYAESIESDIKSLKQNIKDINRKLYGKYGKIPKKPREEKEYIYEGGYKKFS